VISDRDAEDLLFETLLSWCRDQRLVDAYAGGGARPEYAHGRHSGVVAGGESPRLAGPLCLVLLLGHRIELAVAQRLDLRVQIPGCEGPNYNPLASRAVFARRFFESRVKGPRSVA
jgi:hypothetical protein